MSETTLSELVHAIHHTLQPFRGGTFHESFPQEKNPQTYDGHTTPPNKSIESATDRARRDSGISVSSQASPIHASPSHRVVEHHHLMRNRGGTFVSDLSSPSLSRSTTHIHSIDTGTPIASPHLAQSPIVLRTESHNLSPAFSSSPLIISRPTLDHKPSRDERPAATSLTKILQERKLQSAPVIPTLPSFSARKGCILAPGCSIEAHKFRATTESGSPAWWCRYDNLVVFDGIEPETQKIKTRSSKGLAIANQRGQEEVIIVKLDCNHCRDILGLRIWKYVSKVSIRTVCKICQARCKEEYHRNLGLLDSSEPNMKQPLTAPPTQHGFNASDSLTEEKTTSQIADIDMPTSEHPQAELQPGEVSSAAHIDIQTNQTLQ